jgi:serine O-acetyltransferase
VKIPDLSSARGAWGQDRAAYPPGWKVWLDEPSLFAVGTYRLGRWGFIHEHRAVLAAARILGFIWKLTLGIEISLSADIGPGLRIYHQGPIVLGARCRIGARCRLRHGVTLGVKVKDGPAPQLGDDVFLGAYAQVLGGVTIGDGAEIGAMSLVLRDVPARTAVGGIPARPLRSNVTLSASHDP